MFAVAHLWQGIFNGMVGTNSRLQKTKKWTKMRYESTYYAAPLETLAGKDKV